MLWRLGGNLTSVSKYLKGQCKEKEARLFSVVPSARTRGHGHTLKHSRFLWTSGYTFLLRGWASTWHRLPKEVMESPSLEIFNSHLDMVLGNCLSRGGMDQMTSRDLFQTEPCCDSAQLPATRTEALALFHIGSRLTDWYLSVHQWLSLWLYLKRVLKCFDWTRIHSLATKAARPPNH